MMELTLESKVKIVIFGDIGEYKVDENGVVYSRLVLRAKKKRIDSERRMISNEWRKLSSSKVHKTNRYSAVMIYRKGRYQRTNIHKIVAEHFLGNKSEPGIVINHKNGIRSDNRVSNLELVTSKQNATHGSKRRRLMKDQYLKKLKSVVVDLNNFILEYENTGTFDRRS